MNETDAMKLLAEANPVRIDTIGAVELPDSLFATAAPSQTPRPRGCPGLLAALAASLIGVFGFGLVTQRLTPMRRDGPVATARSDHHRSRSRSRTSPAALGAPVVLPDTPLLNASDASAWGRKIARPSLPTIDARASSR